jgi:hypothetical protein
MRDDGALRYPKRLLTSFGLIITITIPVPEFLHTPPGIH